MPGRKSDVKDAQWIATLLHKGMIRGSYVPVNRFQEIGSDNFALTCQSPCDDQQQLDFVFENSFGRRVEYTVAFGGESVEENEE